MRVSRRQFEAITGRPAPVKAAPPPAYVAPAPAPAPQPAPPPVVNDVTKYAEMIARIDKLERDLTVLLSKPTAYDFSIERDMTGRIAKIEARKK